MPVRLPPNLTCVGIALTLANLFIVIVAISTNGWSIVNYKGTNWSVGLWSRCGCYSLGSQDWLTATCIFGIMALVVMSVGLGSSLLVIRLSHKFKLLLDIAMSTSLIACAGCLITQTIYALKADHDHYNYSFGFFTVAAICSAAASICFLITRFKYPKWTSRDPVG